jgi:phosphatidylinositol glycan class U
VLGTFKAYLTLADPGLFLSMMSLFPEVHGCKFSFSFFSPPALTPTDSTDLRHPIVTTLLHLHAALLLPLQHVLWVSEGRGNANFYYAASLVMGMAGGAGFVDACFAGMRIAIGDVKVEGKAQGQGQEVQWEAAQE